MIIIIRNIKTAKCHFARTVFYISIGLLLIIHQPIKSQTTFLVESLPSSTPTSDSLFICGTFNNWNVHDVNFQLHRQMNGKYAITLPAGFIDFEYKFTRGSWMKVETNKKNEYIPNRKQNGLLPATVNIVIENWQDLGGVKPFNYFVFLLFAIALLGLVFIFLVLKIEKQDFRKVLALVLSSLLLVFALLGAFFYEESNLIWQTYLSMLGHCILFMWGPALYLVFKILNHLPINRKSIFLFGAPFIILLIHGFQLFNFQGLLMYTREINPNITLGDAFIVFTGFLYNLVFHLKSNFQFIKGNSENTSFHTLFRLSFTGLFALLLNELLLISGLSWNLVQNYTLTFIFLSAIIVYELYLVFKKPEAIKIKNLSTNQWSFDIIERIENVMSLEKPYKNPELNISELSSQMDIKPHILSKILNEYYKKNFRDFINEYRVKEFIHLLSDARYQNYTFLALAHEVGFNSKSTFNLAFKKITRLSPREYLSLNHKEYITENQNVLK